MDWSMFAAGATFGCLVGLFVGAFLGVLSQRQYYKKLLTK